MLTQTNCPDYHCDQVSDKHEPEGAPSEPHVQPRGSASELRA